jgi:hypothetical protein
MNNLITQPQGCILQPPHITVDALAAIARSQGATHHHAFTGPDGRHWFEWWQQKPLPPDAVLWPYPTATLFTPDPETHDL